jgi:hypothetical protein
LFSPIKAALLGICLLFFNLKFTFALVIWSSFLTFAQISRGSASLACGYVLFSTWISVTLLFCSIPAFLSSLLAILNLSAIVTAYVFEIPKGNSLADSAFLFIGVKFTTILLLVGCAIIPSPILIALSLSIFVTSVGTNLGFSTLHVFFVSTVTLFSLLALDFSQDLLPYLASYFVFSGLFFSFSFGLVVKFLMILVFCGFPIGLFASAKLVLISFSVSSMPFLVFSLLMSLVVFLVALGDSASDSASGPSGSIATTKTPRFRLSICSIEILPDFRVKDNRKTTKIPSV